MRASISLFALLATATLSYGCTGEKEAPPKPTRSAITATAKRSKGPEPPPALPIDRALLSLSRCELAGDGIDPACPALKTYEVVKGRSDPQTSASLGSKHLRHESPAVRYAAAGLIRPLVSSRSEIQAIVVKAATVEKHPLVLKRLIALVGRGAKVNSQIADLLLSMADHEDPAVRLVSISWLNTSWAREIKGALTKVMEKIDKDPSFDVRYAACAGAGNHGDERLIPVYKRWTAPAADPKMYGACMRGLIQMWNPFVNRSNLSRRAYRLTLARLSEQHRDKERPPWSVIGHMGRRPKSNPRWYDKSAVVKVLRSVALDGRAHRQARIEACRALGRLKEQRTLQEVRKELLASRRAEDRRVAATAADELAR